MKVFKPCILAACISLLMFGCASTRAIPEPDIENQTLVIGMVSMQRAGSTQRSGIRIYLEPVDGGRTRALTSRADGLFYSTSIPPGIHRLTRVVTTLSGGTHTTTITNPPPIRVEHGSVNNLGVISGVHNRATNWTNMTWNSGYVQARNLFNERHGASNWNEIAWENNGIGMANRRDTTVEPTLAVASGQPAAMSASTPGRTAAFGLDSVIDGFLNTAFDGVLNDILAATLTSINVTGAALDATVRENAIAAARSAAVDALADARTIALDAAIEATLGGAAGAAGGLIRGAIGGGGVSAAAGARDAAVTAARNAVDAAIGNVRNSVESAALGAANAVIADSLGSTIAAVPSAVMPILPAGFQQAPIPTHAASLDHSIRNMAEELSADKERGARVAVLSMYTGSARMSDYLINEMIVALMGIQGRQGFTMLSRAQVTGQSQFNMAARLDDTMAQTIGRTLGAQYVIIGTFEPLAGFFRFRTQLISVAAGLRGIHTVDVQNDSFITYLLSVN